MEDPTLPQVGPPQSARVEGSRFPGRPLIIRVPFSYYSVLIREPKKKKGKRVLLGHLGFRV